MWFVPRHRQLYLGTCDSYTECIQLIITNKIQLDNIIITSNKINVYNNNTHDYVYLVFKCEYNIFPSQLRSSALVPLDGSLVLLD
jgi:hypothetical protein